MSSAVARGVETTDVPQVPGWFATSREQADRPEIDSVESASLARRTRRWTAVAAVSFVFHSAIAFILAAIILPQNVDEQIFAILSLPADAPDSDDDTAEVIIEAELPSPTTEESIQSQRPVDPSEVAGLESPSPAEISALQVPEVPTFIGFRSSTASRSGAPDPRLQMTAGRSGATKRQLLLASGGSDLTEAAVERGLRWLKNVQLDDGGWDFRKIRDAPEPGYSGNRVAATSMALLSFLGAGHSHKQSPKYRATVFRALKFLKQELNPDRATNWDGDARGKPSPSMYAHCLAVLALSEAYVMTGDESLRPFVEATTRFLTQAQHERGGWRYRPKERGDTSVVGWAVMAIVSARAGGVEVPRMTFVKSNQFLDSVSADDGAMYGYMSPARRKSTTPVGLLSRMYLGWNRSESALKRGVAHLDRFGPDTDDMYYNYYATQVMHHWGKADWVRWNNRMKAQLLQTQTRGGLHHGSWDVADRHGNTGGRLYMTCLCLMTLEVYYRHLPLYTKGAVLR
ncbi:prenyltransferase/squalene oxidase repeat-containing protein [Stratiformator vulcanicus]|uniref:Squalene cyclase C-terminal domain-containing protein n=1 Tax=Stratiformator vulcanicus TaxID=2527980 RepID=A0A517R1Y3_9PLAN|nr:prenyltransferase/squalene oxidase repeat-containing protein [Stratiformator vulcanicus]QDT37897.1 hypothetical protein Pan189_22800 [Stratiformator vulcanicus]